MSKNTVSVMLSVMLIMIAIVLFANVPAQNCKELAVAGIRSSTTAYVGYLRGELQFEAAEEEIASHEAWFASQGCYAGETLPLAGQVMQETLSALRAEETGSQPAEVNAHIERAWKNIIRLTTVYGWEGI